MRKVAEKRIYLDTSAFLKEFTKESGSEIVHKIFGKCENGPVTIITSRWTRNEVTAALDRKHVRGEITNSERDILIFIILRRIERLGSRIVEIRVTNEVLGSSSGIITDKHLSADDALHLYSANVGRCHAFVLADDRFAKRAKNGGDFEIFNLLNEEDCRKLEAFLEREI
jgi:predicted nucleic acid-binding protein